MAKRIIVVVGILVLAGLSVLGQSTPSIQGVWRRVEVTSTNPKPTANQFPTGTHTNIQPGLMIFTAKHYSSLNDTGVKPRPPLKDAATATGDELRASWGSFTANSGTYELSGSTLTMRPIVAKNSQLQGKAVNRATIKLEQGTLWVTLTETGGTKLQAFTTAKYTRIE